MKDELQSVWKTSVVAAGKKVEVSGASRNVKFARVGVTFAVMNARFTERDASYSFENGISPRVDGM